MSGTWDFVNIGEVQEIRKAKELTKRWNGEREAREQMQLEVGHGRPSAKALREKELLLQ